MISGKLTNTPTKILTNKQNDKNRRIKTLFPKEYLRPCRLQYGREIVNEHGLHTHKLEFEFDQIISFLDKYDTEIIILDLNGKWYGWEDPFAKPWINSEMDKLFDR